MNLSISANLNAASVTLRPAKLTSAPQMKIDKNVVYMSAERGTTGPSQTITIQNRSSAPFKLVEESFIFTGPDADKFEIVSGRLPRTIQAGAKATYRIALRAGAGEDLDRVLTANVAIKASSAPGASAAFDLRAIATAGRGGNLEPSLARIMDLYGFTVDVGDPDPSTTALDLNTENTDEVFAQRFQKSGSGPVTITPIAQFVSDAPVPGRLGYYTPGTPDSRKELFTLGSEYAQSVSPAWNGSTTFEPGGSPFSLYAQIPVFVDNGEPRRIYGEDGLNTWESDTSDRRKVRVYQLSERNQKVDNAYVVTFEDWDQANDQNDYVYVIRGVTPLKSGPEIGFISLGGQPAAGRLAFSEIGNKNTNFPNYVASTQSIRVVNTGNRDLIINSVSLDSAASGKFQIVNGPSSPVTVSRNGTYDITVRFTATGHGLHSGGLVIASNDKDESSVTVPLTGFWQSDSEMNNQGISQEPTLGEIYQLLGYKTAATWSGQDINGNGAVQAIGDEVLSSYWEMADKSFPVKIQQVAAYRQQGTNNEIAWYEQGKPWYGPGDSRYPGADDNGPRNTIFRNNALDGQTILPRINGGSGPAAGTFTFNGIFGFRVDGEFSDHTLNIQQPGSDGTHHFRFYPVRDPAGDYVPDTYLVVMDFSAINYDYNDNLYLITNIRPADRNAAITGLAGYSDTSKRIVLDWADAEFASGYRVTRSDRANGKYKGVAEGIFGSTFVDTNVEAGKTYYYRVFAIADSGLLGMPASTGVTVRNA